MGRALLERARTKGSRVGRLEQRLQGELESCSGVGAKKGRPMDVTCVSSLRVEHCGLPEACQGRGPHATAHVITKGTPVP